MSLQRISILLFCYIGSLACAEDMSEAKLKLARELAVCSAYYSVSSRQLGGPLMQQMKETSDKALEVSSSIIGSDEAKGLYEREEMDIEKSLEDCLSRPENVTREWALKCTSFNNQMTEKYALNCKSAVFFPEERIEYWRNKSQTQTGK